MKRPSSKDALFVSAQLLLFIAYFMPLFPDLLHIHIVFRIASLICAIIGLIIIGLAVLQLNKNLTPFPTPKENSTLIQTGLYKFVRHPIYSGIIMATIGYGLFDESLWKTGIGMVIWILFYFKSIYEEKLLAMHFTEYEAYTRKTGRFFPLL